MDVLLNQPEFQTILTKYPRGQVRNVLREFLNQIRRQPDSYQETDLHPQNLAEIVVKLLSIKLKPSLESVINATGTILHTNLGRAILAKEAIQAVTSITNGYSNLELRLSDGKRGQRADHVAKLLCELTNAESAFVVNNNAGAVLLILTALAKNKEVIVSRGELIEIGGKFRIPDVMTASGAILREVGTTNRTHLYDYENAVNDNTALLLKAHRSNFSVVGFTREVSLDQLIGLGKAKHIPVMFDLGSGSMIDTRNAGVDSTPVSEHIKEGVDLLCFSGDKLLGGPQAGIILGQKEFVEKVASHPLARALRIDKMTLAALEATLNLYRDPELAWEKIPVLRMLALSESDLKLRAQKLSRKLRGLKLNGFQFNAQKDTTAVGGGALPMVQLPSWVISVRCEYLSAQKLQDQLRSGSPPIIGRIQSDMLLLDMRTVADKEEIAIYNVFSTLFQSDR
ncbi:L-seryl-tRNA(Sec) selenium transferase [bacterium]|nr:L-seryl-tRNA(Sec) selenium transferase [candidate division CSSED10-310 bacterium]